MSNSQKLNGWRLSTNNILPKLQGKAIEAGAGLLSAAEANNHLLSIQNIYQRLHGIAGEEHLRIYSLPADQQASAYAHWQQLMVEPLKIKSMLAVCESSLKLALPGPPLQNGQSSASSTVSRHEPLLDIPGQQMEPPIGLQIQAQPPLACHASTARSYHTIRTDDTQLSAANPFSPQYSDYLLGMENLSVSERGHYSQEAMKAPSIIAPNCHINTVPPPPGFPPMTLAHSQVAQNGQPSNFHPIAFAHSPVGPPPGFPPMQFMPNQFAQNVPPNFPMNHGMSSVCNGDARANATQFQQCNYSVSSSTSHVGTCQRSPEGPTPKPQKTRLESKLPRVTLPRFDGRKEKYPDFIQAFRDRVASREDITKLDKLYCLTQCLSGGAKAAIEGYALKEDNYEKCISLLEREYGCDKDIAYQIRDTLDSFQAPRDNIHSLTDFVNKVCAQFRRLEGMDISCDQEYIVRRIVDKLPLSWREQWGNESKYGLTTTLSDFQPFLRNRLQVVRRNNLTETKPEGQDRDTRKPHQSLANSKGKFTKHENSNPKNAQKTSETPSYTCIFCKGTGHWPTRCTVVTNREDRLRAIGRNCHNCLGSHPTKECTSDRRCFKCQERHHSTLCPLPRSSNHGLIAATPTHGLTAATEPVGKGNRTLLTASVKAKNKAKTAFTDAVVVFDTGATRSYVTSSFASRLNLTAIAKAPLLIHGFAGSVHAEQSRVVSLEIQTKYGDKEITANTIKSIAQGPVDVPGATSVAPQNIDILIGLDYVFDFIKVPTIKIGDETRIQTSVGDVLLLSDSSTAASSHTLLAVDGFSDRDSLAWRAEYGDILPIQTNEELQTLKFFDETTRKGDRYIVSLPFKGDTNSLPTNFGLAMGQLRGTVHRLREKPGQLKEYDKIIKDQLESGILEIAPHRSDNKVHVIPHHPVFKTESATTKTRSVINCSAKSSKDEPSLNDMVHQGPDLLPQLIGILLRSRTRFFFVSADVEKAFHQIELDEQDRDYVRIIWLKDINKPCEKGNLITYRFARVLFGLKTSPFLLSAVLRLHFTASPGNEAVIRNTYVDNIFIFTDDKEFGIREKFRLKELLSDARMNLRAWYANDPDIEEVFEESEKYAGSVTKILGIEFDKESDSFVFHVEIADTGLAWTPARIIKAQLQVFDPLGLLLPAFVPIKAFLHKLTKSKAALKSPLSPQQLVEWREILQQYSTPCSIVIPRYAGKGNTYELHVFSDASMSFVAACAYLRVKLSDNSYCVTLLMAKNKVKDELIREVDDQKIPKLELVGIGLAAEMMQKITEEIDVKFSNRFLWSDSRIALAWIQKCPELPFVARRLPEILKMRSFVGYVSSSENPADLPTRGCPPSLLRNNKLWFSGPQWLQGEDKDWPHQPEPMKGTDIDERVVLLSKTASSPSKNMKVDIVLPGLFDLSRFSSYTKATSVANRLIFVAKIWLSKIGRSLLKFGENKREDHRFNARSLLLKDEQTRYSSVLQSTDKVTYSAGVYVFIDRFINARGIETSLPVLPMESKLAALIVLQVHSALMHAGVPQTLANVRKHVWILKGRRLVTQLVESCPTCRRFHAKPFRLPEYPDHPAERVNRAEPFKYTGLDYFGPLTLKNEDKRWCLLLTCLVTRAIHLELVPNLTVLSFINALTRFTCRKRVPTVIYSDNATTFRSASKLFRLITVFSHDPHAQHFLAQNHIDWRFLTERAPWKGGLYERLIGIVKSGYKKVVGRQSLEDDTLRTIIGVLENAVNQRPLTYVGANSLTPIRPCDFLGQIDPKPIIAAKMPEEEEENDPEWLPSAPAGREDLARKLSERNLQIQKIWQTWTEHYLKRTSGKTTRQISKSSLHHRSNP